MIPLWIKLAYTLMAVGVLALYWRRYGAGNYLWFSDVALILLIPALWLENALLASVVAMGTLALELFWNLDLLLRLLTGLRGRGLTCYMFEAERPLWLRALSLYHVPLPLATIWLLLVLGYDARALPLMLALGWAVLLASWWLTAPKDNVNWVHGFGGGGERRARGRLAHLLALMAALPLLVWLPSHWVLIRLFAVD